MPEDQTQTPSALDANTLDQLRRHGLLRSLLNALVQQDLLKDVVLEPEIQRQAMQSYRQRHSLTTSEQVQTHQKSHGFSLDDLQWQACLPERIRRVSLERFKPKAELHYLTRKEQFDQVAYTQLSVPNQFLAQELFLRLNEGEASFGQLANQLRQSGHQKGQGRVGPIAIASVPKPIAKRLRSCSPGTLLEPIQAQSSWLIVRLEQFQPSQFDAGMEQRMCTELFQQEVDRIVDQRLLALISSRSTSNGNQSN